jgi:dTDP-4-amino-4,6-dideoxygalactose transaminase
MKIPFVDLYAQYLTIQPDIDDAIDAVIEESGFIRSRFVDEFEQQYARALGAKHCVSCANGTDAIYIAMKGLGIKPGDEVITTAHSWISTSETITQAGGKVIFCDTDAVTFTIDPAQIETRITPRTVGIIPVHLYGQPAKMDAIMAIARKYNLWVVEDCAQAHLAEYKGRKVGTFGNAGTFSFYPGKNLGAMGDAGCLITNDCALADWCATYSRHGGKGDHKMEGINSRLDGLQAAILSVKLPRLVGWTKSRQEIAAKYNSLLEGAHGVKTPGVAEDRTHVYHLYVIRSENRNELKERLKSRGVDSVLHYPKILPLYPAYAYLRHQPSDFPNAYKSQTTILSIPIYPEMNEEQLLYIADAIKDSH